MSSAGRPSKLTPEIQADLCKALREGNYLETACAFVGVSRVTVRTWMRRGARSKRGAYREFLNAIKKAMAEGEMNALQAIASSGEWQAAAWRLERKHYKRWGKKENIKLDHSGAVNVGLPGIEAMIERVYGNDDTDHGGTATDSAGASAS